MIRNQSQLFFGKMFSYFDKMLACDRRTNQYHTVYNDIHVTKKCHLLNSKILLYLYSISFLYNVQKHSLTEMK